MRLVSIPVGLTPHRLLALRGISASLTDQLNDTIGQSIDGGRYDDALATAERIFPTARSMRDQNAQALVYLYKAEILHRMLRWEEALEHTQQALSWLRAEVTQVAAYNKAVAVYFEGLLHFILRADANALQAFSTAQEALVESERFWGFEKNITRANNCQILARWISKLQELASDNSPGELVMIVPAYEIVNRTLALVDALSITPFLVQLPKEALGEYLPANYVPLEIEAVLFLQLWPDTHYLALKIPGDGELVRQSRAGDILLIEVTSPAPPYEVKLTRDMPFVRRPGGRIIFGPYEQQNEIFSGIPRILIRKEDES
jgi:tetratricopeptide (TPR) repeat protein